MSIYAFLGSDRVVYDAISGAIDSQEQTVLIPKTSAEKCLALYKKAISERTLGFLYRPDAIRIRTSAFGSVLDFDLCDESKNRIAFCSQVEFETDAIIAQARKAYSVYDRIQTVYQYFIEHFSYTAQSADHVKYHMTASPFLFREAVCEGFAFAFAHVMNRMQIPCGIVSGLSAMNGTAGLHAWNILEIKRKCYHADVTWDICTKEKGTELLDYCLLSDELMRKDHAWKDESLPTCTDSSKDYYVREHLICNNMLDVLNLIIKNVKQKKTAIGFRCVGNQATRLLSPDSLRAVFQNAMRECNCPYSEVKYGLNTLIGTGYFRIVY